MFYLSHKASLPTGINPATFINIALLDSIPKHVMEIRKPYEPLDDLENSKSVATFYSISSHPGLTGIKIGSNLIERSVERLRQTHPSSFFFFFFPERFNHFGFLIRY
jgi:hypothetical protein